MATRPSRDNLLFAIAQQSGSIENLLDDFFSFLRRHSDFYVIKKDPNAPAGFKAGEAEEILLKCYHKQWKVQHDEQRPVPTTPSSLGAAMQGTPKSFDAGNPEEMPPPEDINASLFNGGKTDWFYWMQDQQHIEINIPIIGDKILRRDVSVKFQKDCITVSISRKIQQARLPFREIVPNECTWTLNGNKTGDQQYVSIFLEKAEPCWWDVVFKGDEQKYGKAQIESKVQFKELDEDTRVAVGKVMEDHKRKLAGEKTIEEERVNAAIREAWNAPGSPFAGTAPPE